MTAVSREKEFSFSYKEFRFLADFVYERTGITLGDHKQDMVYGRLVRRLRHHQLDSFKQYCEFLKGEHGDEEIANLVNAITTNLTHFFRERHHNEHLADEVLRPLVANPPPGKRLRIWSAGCSSGMEPYSIAMTLAATIPNIGSWDAKILATDIDTNMLDTGRKGEYKGEEYKNIPKELQEFVTLKKEGREELIQVSPRLQHLIAFKPLNLMESWPMKGPFDAIFCRNVVIYFDKPTQKILFERMAALLKPGGWLYIGHSESLHNVNDQFELKGRTIYQKVA